MSRSFHTVVFSHGMGTGPWGTKITALAAVARDLGIGVQSVDYQGVDDPLLRVDRLLASAAALPAPLVLVGSSLGGHVSAAVAARVRARGLFLMAPAFYMPGFEQYTPQDVVCPVAIVHGWGDAVVPVDNSIRWARERGAALHVLDSDHRLQNRIPELEQLFRDFLLNLG